MGSLSIPFLGKGSGTKEKIILLLSQQWPLNTKKIHFELEKFYSLNITYQAVHKLLKQMEEEKIVERGVDGYKITKDWIQKTKKFSEQLEEMYSEKGKALAKESGEPIKLKFNNFLDAARFIVNNFYFDFLNPQRKPSLCIWKHVACPIGATERENENFRKIFSYAKHYAVTNGNTFLDKYFAKYYETLGKKIKLSIDFSMEEDIFINGDYIAQMFYDRRLRKELNEVYDNTKEFNEFDLAKQFERITNKNYVILIFISKNSELADFYRWKFIKYFNN
ncbi:MAG: hypothetical protein AB1467_01530 [Candidatus Diapherotrites archaeon]